MQLQSTMQMPVYILQAKVMHSVSSGSVRLDQKCTTKLWKCCKKTV